MSLLRNFSPGGSEPDDNEQPITDEQPASDEQPTAPARSDETAPPEGGQGGGTARYAFAAPSGGTGAGAGPAPDAVPSEVVAEPDLADPAGFAEETSAPAAESPAFEEAPAPSFTPAPGTLAAEAPDPEATVPEMAPVPAAQAPPAPVPSPRATDETAGRPAAMPRPDFTAPLLGDMAELRTRWQRVQGDFVDDPQAAVSNAADLVGQTAEALVDALRQRQRQLRTAWERDAADGQSPAAMAPATPDTEHLRLMMQRYRSLFNELCRPS